MEELLLKNKYIAHRGLHNGVIPENSLKAFQKAIEKNYMIELDVHLLSDDTVVVFHDNNLKRMTNINKKIENCTFEEIKKYNLLDTNEKIPTLEQVLKLINGNVPILLELKVDTKVCTLEEKVLDIIKDYKGIIYFQTFCLRSYLKVRKTNYKAGLLIKRNKKELYYLSIFLFTKLFKPDFISVHYSYLNNKYIKKLNNTIPVFVWTIRNEENYNKCKQADGIIFENETCIIDKKVI